MSQEDILAKLKKDVCSLLLSSKLGLDPEQLRQDYFNMLGHPMPLKVLGFRNIMDMVKEMPDVVSVHYGPDGSPCLRAVSNEKTRNIEELVAKQRVSKADRIKKQRFKHFSPRYCYGFTPVIIPRRGHAPPALPAHLRMQLRLMLCQGPVRLADLELCYLRSFGYPLRVHDYGFYSTVEMLVAASDMILIQQSRLGSLLALREHMMPRPLIRPANLIRKTEPMKPAFLPTNSQVSSSEPTKRSGEVLVKESPVIQPSETSLNPVQQEPNVSSKLETHEKFHETKPVACQEDEHLEKLIHKLEEELRQQILENGVAGTINPELKDKLRKVVGQSSDGLSVHDLPTEYKKLFGEDLPYSESGFVSVTELIDALSDMFHLEAAEGDSGHDWIIRNKQDCDVRHSDTKETAASNDDGKMPAKNSYFSSDVSPWEGKQGGTDGDEGEMETTITCRTQEMVSELYTTVEAHCRSVIPLDALKNQRLRSPKRRGARELVEVLVEQVKSPGSFYISFSESKEVQAMENLMFEMRRCYTCPEVSKWYRLPQPYIRVGQVCCVSPEGMWFYRVVIHRILNPTQVEVYYADFGDITVVQSDSLKFLKSSYSILPAQAVPSALAGIKPTSVNWTPEATASFQKLCSNRTLVGALDCYAADVLQLYLCDTHTDQDIYAHSVLINQGHGVACSPAASAALCVQVTPVSLYFGEDLADLPEVDEKLILPLDFSEPSKESALIEEEEPPGLELIEEREVNAPFQGMNANPFITLADKQTLSCGEQIKASTSSASTPLAPPDLIQARKTPPLCKEEPKEDAQPTGENDDSSLRPSSILKLLSLHTPHLGQIQDSSEGPPVSSLYLRKPSIIFPVFGAR
ncbi:tudor domain-containing protein 5 isoform X2 [Austrofundulus limnaeus]|uniref:Tudor domain-containing protein 5 n=1 Tax=Austrofundulus limnaeus TaxID=52670 RepID=A0A2I4B4U1_AUSLI|nr:PREDICTED: tudor domain-containing protein 5 isoform X2 [Austrofundulus limnaeus]